MQTAWPYDLPPAYGAERAVYYDNYRAHCAVVRQPRTRRMVVANHGVSTRPLATFILIKMFENQNALTN